MGNWALAKTWVKLTTGAHLNSERNLGKEREKRKYTDDLERRDRGDKMGKESLSVSSHLP